jgi:branched-chain amino acid transport system substrate-binding protein
MKQLKQLAMAASLAAIASVGLSSAVFSTAAQARRRKSSSSRCWSIAPAPMPPTATRGRTAYVDYLKLVNAKGGINGVKISFEECETGYATDRGVECYERLKGKGATVCSSRCPPASPSR